MPQSSELQRHISVRMPNDALSSLAGNIDHYHRIAISDLILERNCVKDTIKELLIEYSLKMIRLSIMTFQRHKAFMIIRLIHDLKPYVKITVGG